MITFSLSFEKTLNSSLTDFMFLFLMSFTNCILDITISGKPDKYTTKLFFKIFSVSSFITVFSSGRMLMGEAIPNHSTVIVSRELQKMETLTIDNLGKTQVSPVKPRYGFMPPGMIPPVAPRPATDSDPTGIPRVYLTDDHKIKKSFKMKHMRTRISMPRFFGISTR